jgi:hypothetical protein
MQCKVWELTMNAGYLFLETHPSHPGLLRLQASTKVPRPPQGTAGGEIRYIAEFQDLDTAYMRTQCALRSGLIDLDSGLWRAELVQTMAIIESEILSHRRVWIDPALDDQQLRELDRKTDDQQRRRARFDRLWNRVGLLGIALLMVQIMSWSI